MSYLVLALKYRPQTFDEIVGQEHVSKTLKNAITSGKVAHAYLFSGPRGIGKTTTARILAKALNCKQGPTPQPCNKCTSCVEIVRGSSIDVLEIDGASNRGIDEIRALRENVKFAPVSSHYKIYIIDEAHQITHDAFNALLKTLEEPPRHVIFMLATTQPERIPPTILSRCQRFSFKLIPQKKIFDRLNYIVGKEKLKIEKEVLDLIAYRGEGSLRDAQSLLDQVISYAGGKKIDLQETNFILGVLPFERLVEFSDLIAEHKGREILSLIDEITESGYNLHQFIKDLRQHFRNMLLIKVAGENTKILQLPHKHLEILLKKGGRFTEENMVRIIDLLSKTYESMKWSEQPRLVIEVDMFRLCQPYIPIGEIIERIRRLEKSLTLEEKKGEPSAERYVREGKKPPLMLREEKKLPAGDNSEIQEIGQRWEEVLESVRKLDIPLHSCLLEGSPVRMEGELLYIVFPKNYSFHKDRVEKKSNIVEQAIKGVLGKELKIKCMTGEINATSPTKEKVEKDESAPEEFLGESEPEEKVVAPNQEPVFNSEEKKEVDPIVEKVLKMFEGKIVKEEREEK
ncbi:DNA polymerase III subunit gamma/tau [subsurface metagenome]|nr:DNA polymerase III subunit gamma/tau [Clostridia bacterium]